MKEFQHTNHIMPLFTTTPTGLVTSFNEAAEKLLGYKATEVVGKINVVVFHDSDELRQRVATIGASGHLSSTGFSAIAAGVEVFCTAQQTWTYVHRQGERFPVRVLTTAIAEGQRIGGYVTMIQDLRAASSAEELIRHQSQLLDFANDAILVRDLKADTITYWNQGASRLYGWSRAEAVGAYIHEFLRTVFPQRLDDIKREFLRNGYWAGELIHTTRHGDRITVSSRWTLLRDATGVPTGSLELNTDITDRKRAEEALKAAQVQLERRVNERTADLSEATERLRMLSRRLMEVQESERRTIARDLHDEIGQALMALKLNLREIGGLQRGAPADTYVADSLEILDQVLQRVRSMALDLRPSLLDELGLVPALRWYVGRQAARAGWMVNFCAHEAMTRPSADVEITCFRLAQEALTNVARHARAGRIDIQLEVHGSEMIFSIRDDGIGFDVSATRTGPRAGATSGLSGMEERVRLVGGEISFNSAPGRGTYIQARFPHSTSMQA